MTLSWWQDIERRAASLKGSLGISQASAKGRWQIDFSPSTLRPPGAQKHGAFSKETKAMLMTHPVNCDSRQIAARTSQ